MSGGDALQKLDEEFRLYRKYSAEAEIKYDADPLPPLPDDKTKETPATQPKPNKK
jgi:hypothetical protein